MPLQKNSQPVFSVLFAALILPFLLSSCSKPEMVVIEPVEFDDVLVNPGMGFTTFYSFNHDEINTDHPECSIAYFRWYWDVLEPEEGRINSAMIDSILAICRERDQKLAFRVMCQNGHEMADKSVAERWEVPEWFKNSGAGGCTYENGRSWQPDYDDPIFLEKHGNLIRALAARYDGHPDLDHVDIGSVGRWGEWHTSRTGCPMPSEENMKRIVDLYLDNFRKTPLVMNIDGGPALEYAVSRGTGWRADCLGDMRSVTDDTNWDHMHIAYPQAIEEYNLGEVWKNAPVALETCWNMLHWEEKGWDVEYIFEKALEWRVSVLNNKSFPIPEQWWPKVERLQKKMGYRFVLKLLEHSERSASGKTLILEMTWENKGVAPCYLKHPVAVELRKEQSGESFAFTTDIDITGWLPGTHQVSAYLKLPPDMPSGEYEILLAFLDPHSLKPRIKLAIEGQGEDGWYRVSRVKID